MMKKTKQLKSFLSLALLGVGIFSLTGIAGAAPAENTINNDMKKSATMENRIKASDEKYQQLFGNANVPEATTDPDFADTMKRFIYGEVEQQGSLTSKQRELITLVVLETNGNTDLFRKNVSGALNVGATPVEIKETIYQAAPYIGFPKALDALHIVNEVFKKKGISLPLESQSTVTESRRFDKGLAVQKQIFGSDHIDQAYANAPKDQIHIQRYLSGFCFGDTYTRGALDLKTRELLTLSSIAALGGCEPQLKAHIGGNISVGNDKGTIIDTITQCMPYIGFPRTLNALRCVNEVLPDKQ